MAAPKILRVNAESVRAFFRQKVEIRHEKRDSRIAASLKNGGRKIVAFAGRARGQSAGRTRLAD